MVRYLLDSNILISVSRGKKKWESVLSTLKEEQFTTSVICAGEMLEGLNNNDQELFLKKLNRFEVFNVGFREIICFSDIRRQLRPKGMLIDNMDVLIAATAIVNNLVLITDNLKHFSRVKGLKIYG